MLDRRTDSFPRLGTEPDHLGKRKRNKEGPKISQIKEKDDDGIF